MVATIGAMPITLERASQARRADRSRRRSLPPVGAPTAARRHPAAVYRRRRILVAGLLAATGLAGWVGVHDLVGSGAGLGPSRDIAQRVVVVRPGDTLWSIALGSGVRGDIRPLVDQLSAEVHGQPIYPGEQLTIP